MLKCLIVHRFIINIKCIHAHRLFYIHSGSAGASSSALKGNLWLISVSHIDLDPEIKLDDCSSISVKLLTSALSPEQGIHTMQKSYFLKPNVSSIIQNMLTVASFQNWK